MQNKLITLVWLALLAIPTLLSAQGNPQQKTFKLEMPVSVKNDTAAFRRFIESPMGKRIKDVSKVTRIEQGPTCPDCPNPYGRWVYEFELFDNSQPPSKLVTETICDGKKTRFKGEVLSKPAIRYDTLASKTGGKDTLLTYVLHVLPRTTEKLQQDVCFGDTVVVNGQKIWETSVIYYTIPGIGVECDVDVSHFVKILPQQQTTKKDSIYLGDTLTIKINNGEEIKVWETKVLEYKVEGLNGKCDTAVIHLITVLPKPGDNRIFFFGEQTVGFHRDRSPINKSLWTSTHFGVTVSHNRRWIWKFGIGWFPQWDFNIPKELTTLPEQPAPDAGWNDCNCDEKKQRFSLHGGIAYSMPFKRQLFGGTMGIRLSLTADYALGGPPVEDVENSQWALPGAVDFQPAFFWQRTIKGGAMIVGEAGPTFQFDDGANKIGFFELRARVVLPTKART